MTLSTINVRKTIAALMLFSSMGFMMLFLHSVSYAEELTDTTVAATESPADTSTETTASSDATADAPADTVAEDSTASEGSTDSTTSEQTDAPVDAPEDTSTTTTTESSSNDSTDQSAAVAASTPSPELSTEKAEYNPEETVSIFGRFFTAIQNIVLRIVGGSLLNPSEIYSTEVFNIVTDETGVFTYNYVLSDLFTPLYTISAEDGDGAVLATTSVIDPLQTSFTQCSNNNPTAGECNWIGSIVQQSNSIYYEGMTVPQRLLFRDAKVVDGAHSITFTYQYTKAGIHAYDFLTTVNPNTGGAQGNGSFAPGTPTLNACSDLAGADAAACTNLNPSGSAPDHLVPIPNDPFDSKDGSSAAQTNKENAYMADFGAPRNISIYIDGGTITPGAITLAHDVAANGDTGDSVVTVTIPFTTSGCSAADGCDILLFFGGHLAVTGDGTGVSWGPGLGSSQISGGPYHIKTVKFDGTGGSQDNQIKGADILIPNNATITIIKDTVPNDSQDFAFTTTGAGLTNFSLDDDGDGSLPNTRVFSALAPGAYTVSEASAAGYSLTNLVCVDPTTNSTVDLNTRTATINLAASESVTCTFTNTLQQGTIIVDKVTVPAADAQSFSFTAGGTGYNGFSLTDAAQPNSQSLNAGIYSISETVPTGWDLTSATCVSSIGDTETIGTLELDAGETITCTFTNTRRGSITIVKNTIGGDGTFDFTGSTGVTQLTTSGGTASQTVNNFVPGEYNITESVPTGWDLTSATCDLDETIQSITVGAGEHVTCTFTNTKQGKILIDKVTDPSGSNQSFEFDPSWSVSNFNLTDAAAASDSGILAPGTYSVSEVNIPAGWNLTNTSCSDGSAVNNISLQAGETVTCTFTNTQNGTIIVDKVTNPSGDTQSFSFTAGGAGYVSFSLTDAAAPNSQSVIPGKYNVTETIPAGWDQASATCDQGETVGDIDVGAGETVTCTFTNTKRGHVVIIKNAIPNSTQDFSFTGSGSIGAFLLDDDGDIGNALPKQRDFEVVPGSYTVSEAAIAGWQQESATCDKGEAINSIDVEPGETVTCTFTNEKLAKITLVKNTIGGNGTFDFVMTGAGLPSSAQLTTVANTASQVFSDLDPDNTYTMAETPVPAGWDLLSATCSNGDPVNQITPNAGEEITCTFTNEADAFIIVDKVTDPAGDLTEFGFTTDYGLPFVLADGSTANNSGDLAPGVYDVTEAAEAGWDNTSISCASSLGDPVDTDGQDLDLDAGETITCTFTNQKDANIIVEKQTIPDGDLAVFDFDLSYGSGDADISDGQQDDSGDLNPGTYSVAETELAGWDLTSTVCTSSIEGIESAATIDLTAGETVTCVFTNTKHGSITIEKQTIGGDADFTFTGDVSGILNDNDTATQEVIPGTYDSTETVTSGWDLTDITCDDSNSSGNIGTGVATFNVAAGENVTCTFTNTKDSKIIVNKVTVGGDGNFDFAASYDQDGFVLANGGSNDSGDIDAGTYSVSETVPAGWDLTSATCDDASDPSSINLAAGETVTCTFTNTKLPTLTLEKEVVIDNGGTAVDTDWTIEATDNDQTTISGEEGDLSITSAIVPIGSYDLSESGGPLGYAASDWVCVGVTQDDGDTVTLGAGDNVTCTITNDDIAPVLHLNKVVVNNSGGTALESAWTLTATGPTSITGPGAAGSPDVSSGASFDAGSYVLSESAGPTGYAASSWSCTNGDNDGTVSIGLGETVTCTITNDDQQAYITVVKVVDNGNGGIANPNDFNLTLEGSPVSSGVAVPVNPGTYTAGETQLPGYIFEGFSGDCDVNGDTTVALGENMTCTLTNNDTPGHFTGGGSVFPNTLETGVVLSGVTGRSAKETRVTHGFTLHCDVSRGPNRLEVNWGINGKKAQKFHLLTLNSAQCTDDPEIDPRMPNAEFDTITGVGTGRFNGVEDATIQFMFNDAGEPGGEDQAYMIIRDKDDKVVLNTVGPLFINMGNQQAHQDN